MTITAAFQNAQAGLAVALRRADIVSSNIANALTPGYVRRDVAVGERTVAGGSGGGPQVIGVTRASDIALTRERRLADAAAANEDATTAAYQALNTALGEPDDAFSLSGKYAQLETTLSNLAATPESTPLQQQVVDAANDIVTAYKQLSDQAQSLREGADRSIANDVSFVNQSLKQIEGLNRDISLASTGGRDTSALQDQRQTLINQISEIIPVREIPRQDGGSDLITQEGVFLIAGTARQIDFTPHGAITSDITYNGGAGQLSGLSVDGVDITPGGPNSSQPIKSGRFAGNFAVRDQIVPEFSGQIDSLAADLVERFQSSDTTLASGAAGLFTDNGAAYDPANEAGLAGRLKVNTLVDPSQGGALFRVRDGLGATTAGPSGNATVVNALLDGLREARAQTAGAKISGLNAAATAVADVASSIGSKRISAEQRQTTARARADSVTEAEQTTLGVDTDAQLQQLALIQTAYAANARVLQVASELLDTLTRIGA